MKLKNYLKPIVNEICIEADQIIATSNPGSSVQNYSIQEDISNSFNFE